MIEESQKDVNLAHAAAEEFREVADTLGNAPISAPRGIAAMALSMAMKYHDVATIKDGVMYQQMKMEGKNIMPIHLDHVLETAERLEMWLVGADERFAKMIVEAIEFKIEDDKPDSRFEIIEDGPGRWVLIDHESTEETAPVFETKEAAIEARRALAQAQDKHE